MTPKQYEDYLQYREDVIVNPSLFVRLEKQFKRAEVLYGYGYNPKRKIMWSYDVAKKMIENSDDYDNDVIRLVQDSFCLNVK